MTSAAEEPDNRVRPIHPKDPQISGEPGEVLRPTVWMLGQFDTSMALAVQLCGTALVVLAGTLIAELLFQAFDLTRLAIFFLGSVIVSALLFGTRAGVLGAFLAFTAYNFSLVEPRFSFRFVGADDALTLIAFLIVALLTGSLAGKVRESERTNRQRADLLETLFEASQIFSLAQDERYLHRSLVERIERASAGTAFVIGPQEEPDLDRLPLPLRSRARALVQGCQALTPLKIDGALRVRRLSGDASLGLALWMIGETRPGEVAPQDRLCEVLIDLAAASMARMRLADVQTEAEAERRAGTLREAILGSLSHDLRTPLATVLASASSLRDYDDRFDAQTRISLADGIVHEATRLNEYLEALFNLSRIESGDLSPRLRPVLVGEIIDRARQRLGAASETLIGATYENTAQEALADPHLLEQVLFNILDNAILHGGDNVQVTIDVSADAECVMITIQDDGPGVSAADGLRLFEKFYRGSNARMDTRGTGVGLSIARGFVEAMGGQVSLRTHPESRGLCLVVRLLIAGSPDP